MADKEASPTTPEAVVICLHPDMCKRGDSVVAYDIVARQSDDEEHSDDVKITDCWASHDGARLKTVYQDAPGDKGVKSGCVEGYARPVKDTSPTVLINGRACVRHDTVFEMNCDGPEGQHNTEGKMAYDRGGPGNVVGAEGALAYSPPIEPTAQEIQAAKDYVARHADVARTPLTPMDHVSGFFEELGEGLIEQARGLHDMMVAAADSHPPLMAALIAQGMVGGMTPAEVVQYQQGVDAAQTEAMAAMIQDPSLFIDAMVGEIPEHLAAGAYGRAAGEVAVFGADAVGAKGAARLGRLVPQKASDGHGGGGGGGSSSSSREGDDGVLVHPKSQASEVFAEGDVPPEQKWSDETYRGDQRTPEQIREAGGFKGKDPSGNISLDTHMNKDRPPSQWVSATKNPDVGRGYAWQPNAQPRWDIGEGDIVGYNYIIDQPGGIDVNTVSGITNTPNAEVAFSNGIPWESVRGWETGRWVGDDIVWEFTPNWSP